MASIERRFTAAGLECKVLGAPLSGADDRIFQLDIQRVNKGQRYGVWMGGDGNRVEVMNVDARLEQLVLFVEEPLRVFNQEILVHSKWDRRRRLEAARQSGARIVKEEAGRFVVELKTDGRKRHLLLGKDESHLFIAQLPRAASSVKQAHEVLRPVAVAGRDDVIRQGEWFFVPASKEEQGLLEAATVKKKVDLGSAGRPHVADEVARVENGTERLVFAKGRVRHVEHRTLELRRWMRVHKNTEAGNDFRALGIRWID